MAVLDFYGMFDFAPGDDDTYRYSSEEFAELIAGVTGNGVSQNTLGCFATAASGLRLTVQSGVCFINGRYGVNRSAKYVNLTGTSGNNKRYDYLVLELDCSQRNINLKTVQGVSDADPSPPGLTQNEVIFQIPLYLCLVSGSTVTLTDKRNLTFSASQIQGELNDRALLNHTHDDIYYRQTYLDTALAGKAPAVTKETPTGTTLAVQDNREYYLTDVRNLTVTYPSGQFECWIKLTTAATGTVTISFPASQYLGGAPDLSQNGMTFEISIKDGIIVGCEAGDGS